MKVIAGTGHRPKYFNAQEWNAMCAAADKAIKDTAPNLVVSGMALGWDQALARAAINHGIPFIAALPFAGQASRWPVKSHNYWQSLIAKAHEVVIVSEGGYSGWKMTKRDHWMVDEADEVVALYNESRPNSGTGRCVSYATKHNKKTINYYDFFVEHSGLAL